MPIGGMMSNGNGNGNSNNGVHSISNQGIHMSSNLANEPNMGPGGDLTSLSSNPLQQHELLRNGPGPQSPPRDEFHHHPSHIHHTQQHIHVHNTHSYHHGQLHPQEIAQEEQFVAQSYGAPHYYGEPDQQDPYHDRPHSGGLVGHPYGHSPDNIVTLTPPPSAPQTHDLPPLRTRLTNTIWEDERTYCFQVDVKGVCVARRADNNMVNGTKLLNVVGMSRGKRDGILKNEKGRVVVKVGAMHLKGVWIPLDRAVHHAKAHHIEDSLHPLLVDDPAEYLYQHPHTAVVSSDMRWASQVQQVQHNLYHDSHESPKARHVDMHSNHHFSQGPHGDYYQQHQPFFRQGASRHGSPHGSNGSISGDEDPNLASPFEYRLQSSMASGGLIGMPSSGSSAPLDARSGGHHQPYYGHQTSPTQYYHTQQKYPEPILHQGQHQLQLGGSLANDSPPMSAGLHQDPSTDHLNRDPLNPPSKRPRQISRVPGVVDIPISSGPWYREAFERTGGQPISTAWGPRS
ncbi:hypothetical protein BGZ52_005048 [Haplosporangium bisporale]|nr:hypothetical protein BGZ52_005048 [Haplosporangium bisporale]